MIFDPTEAAEIAFILDSRLKRPVEVFLFTEPNCLHGADCFHIVSSVSELTAHVRFHTPLCLQSDEARRFGVQRSPALVIKNTSHYGIVHYGVPVGYDFAAFLNTLIEVSEGKPDLTLNTLHQIKNLKGPIRLKVFVGTNCPFCPIATHFANQFSMADDLISAETINTHHFPELAESYNIRSLPTLIVNEEFRMVGIPAENALLDRILEAEKVYATGDRNSRNS